MIGMTFLAAMLVVWIGIWLYHRVGKRMTLRSPKKVDFTEPVNSQWFVNKYGGRLLGGGKMAMGTKGKGGCHAYGPGIVPYGISAKE
eukprot:8997225-Karenia_brevis.AAC.1